MRNALKDVAGSEALAQVEEARKPKIEAVLVS